MLDAEALRPGVAGLHGRLVTDAEGLARFEVDAEAQRAALVFQATVVGGQAGGGFNPDGLLGGAGAAT